ncbi:hypothetical protein CPT_Muldoon_006 [Serratia phage Muldoon]|uniref:Uncharacterized protein n=1 Tax=Serratia phage Muldoon TaxID=2601678 RepID=A0A5P8PH11_9CAUD|nr:hypothetical protein HYP94_gp006 [Serratia phage Muldoon]QFR55963.1 hypothetical protein CPT_Muldoon_006 [Serratia phage Muldoon]UNA02375.1 hypothetical protein [Serratia phage SP1]
MNIVKQQYDKIYTEHFVPSAIICLATPTHDLDGEQYQTVHLMRKATKPDQENCAWVYISGSDIGQYETAEYIDGVIRGDYSGIVTRIPNFRLDQHTGQLSLEDLVPGHTYKFVGHDIDADIFEVTSGKNAYMRIDAESPYYISMLDVGTGQVEMINRSQNPMINEWMEVKVDIVIP